MGAAVMLGHHFDVLAAHVPVDVLVLDPQVWEMHLLVEAREVVILRSFFNLTGIAIRPSITVGSVTISFLEEPLVLAFQLSVELYAQDTGVAVAQAFRRAEVGAIDLRVVGPLAGPVGARVERLTMVGIAIAAVAFQHASASVCQDDGAVDAALRRGAAESQASSYGIKAEGQTRLSR